MNRLLIINNTLLFNITITGRLALAVSIAEICAVSSNLNDRTRPTLHFTVSAVNLQRRLLDNLVYLARYEINNHVRQASDTSYVSVCRWPLTSK